MTMTVDQAKRRGFTGMASLPTAGLPAPSLLLHMDGTNGSTTFTDSSANAITMTANNAQLSTAQAKFGTASGLFDGTGDYLSNGGNAALAYGTADFTIMQWLRPATSPGSGMITYDQRATSSTSSAGLAVYRDSAGKMTFVTGITVRIQGTTVLAANTWYHIDDEALHQRDPRGYELHRHQQLHKPDWKTSYRCQRIRRRRRVQWLHGRRGCDQRHWIDPSADQCRL